LESTIRHDHRLPSWLGEDWHSVALAPELISSSATAMDELFVTLCFLISNLKPHALCCDEDDPKRSKVPNRVILNFAECGMFPFIEWPRQGPRTFRAEAGHGEAVPFTCF
jgi:hypothetical protein